MAENKREIKKVPPLEKNDKYLRVVAALREHHANLLKLYNDDSFKDDRENPALIGETMMKIRLNCNWLFAFINDHYDLLNDRLQDVASYRQGLYEAAVADGKSENAAKTVSAELTRADEAEIKVLENQIKQMNNEYDRGNGLAMGLQSRMKEFDTERRMG